MSIFYVRKDGSGTHTTILGAYMAASAGDTINIGEGTFTESVEVFKQNLTFTGAGKDKTIIQGNYVSGAFSQATGCSWTLGNNFFTYTAQNTGTNYIPFAVGMSVGDTSATPAIQGSFPPGSQITSVDTVNKKVFINKNFIGTVPSGKTVKHYGRQATLEVRASGFTISGIKVIDVAGSVPASSIECAAIYLGANSAIFGTSKYPGSHSAGFNINNCEIVADGDSAILSENNVGVGNGIVDSCIITGKTFTGQYSPGTGNLVKQAVAFQNTNLPVTFTNNKLDVICGGMTNAATPVYGGNQIATIDAYGSVVSGNQFKGKAVDPSGSYFNMTGLALRMRGGNSTASNNVIKGFNGFVTGGYLILPAYSNLSGKTIPVGEVVTTSSRFFKCTQAHVYDAANKAPTVVSSAYWVELTGTPTQLAALLIENSKANYQANSGTNVTITKLLIEVTQAAANSFTSASMGKDALKTISKVSSSAVFSNESNWKLVNYVFKHSSSSRRLVSSFRSDFNSIKKAKLKTNMKAGDTFELQKIIISKADRTHLVIKRNEISEASDYDFILLNDGPESIDNGGVSQPLISQEFNSGDYPAGWSGNYNSFSFTEGPFVRVIGNNAPLSVSGLSIEQASHTMRLYVANVQDNFFGAFPQLSVTLGAETIVIPYSELVSAIGGYVEKTFSSVGQNQSTFSILGVNCDTASVISVSKVEITKVVL